MNKRLEKIQLLNQAFNEGNADSLQTLSRPFFPVAFIFKQYKEGMLFDARLNSTLPASYQDRIMNDNEIGAMLAESGNLNTFFLPDNGRD